MKFDLVNVCMCKGLCHTNNKCLLTHSLHPKTSGVRAHMMQYSTSIFVQFSTVTCGAFCDQSILAVLRLFLSY